MEYDIVIISGQDCNTKPRTDSCQWQREWLKSIFQDVKEPLTASCLCFLAAKIDVNKLRNLGEK